MCLPNTCFFISIRIVFPSFDIPNPCPSILSYPPLKNVCNMSFSAILASDLKFLSLFHVYTLWNFCIIFACQSVSCVCVRSVIFHVWLCKPIDCSSPGSSVHGILQAIILEWLLCPPPGHLSDPGMEPESPVPPALQFTLQPPGKLQLVSCQFIS